MYAMLEWSNNSITMLMPEQFGYCVDKKASVMFHLPTTHILVSCACVFEMHANNATKTSWCILTRSTDIIQSYCPESVILGVKLHVKIWCTSNSEMFVLGEKVGNFYWVQGLTYMNTWFRLFSGYLIEQIADFSEGPKIGNQTRVWRISSLV